MKNCKVFVLITTMCCLLCACSGVQDEIKSENLPEEHSIEELTSGSVLEYLSKYEKDGEKFNNVSIDKNEEVEETSDIGIVYANVSCSSQDELILVGFDTLTGEYSDNYLLHKNKELIESFVKEKLLANETKVVNAEVDYRVPHLTFSENLLNAETTAEDIIKSGVFSNKMSIALLIDNPYGYSDIGNDELALVKEIEDELCSFFTKEGVSSVFDLYITFDERLFSVFEFESFSTNESGVFHVEAVVN